MTANVVEQIVRHRSWTSWSGTMDELRRIADKFDSAVNTRRDVVLESYEKRMANSEDDLDLRMLKREKADIEDASVAKLTFRSGSDTVTGPISSTLLQIDPRNVDTVRLFASFERYGESDQVSIRLRRQDPDEVVLHVSSPDGNWSRSTFSALSEEIQNGVPRWSRCRKLSTRVALGVATYLLLFVASILVASSYLPTRPWAVPIAVVVGFLGQSWTYVDSLRDWFFPAFEIREGNQSTGSRRIALLVGLVLSLPIGVLVNVISPS